MSIIKNLSKFFKRSSSGNLNDVIGAIDNALDIARVDIVELDIEYILATSSGVWLDEWGTWFGVQRIFNEIDRVYRARIQSVATKPKNTIPAIIASIRSYIGNSDDDITIYEPFTNMRKFNISSFSGPDKFPDATYYRPAVIDIRTTGYINDAMRAIVNEIKSAGVKVYFTFTGEIGAREPLFMSSGVEPFTQYSSEIQLLISRSVNSTDTTIVNIGMSYRDTALDLDMVFSGYDNYVDMTANMYKTLTAGSLLIIQSLSDVIISQANSVSDDTQTSIEIVSTP